MAEPIDFMDPDLTIRVIIARAEKGIIFFFCRENSPEEIRKKKEAILLSNLPQAAMLAEFYVEGFTGKPPDLRKRIKELKRLDESRKPHSH